MSDKTMGSERYDIDREKVVRFAVHQLMESQAQDWQEVQTALAENTCFRGWIYQESGGVEEEAIVIIQDVIREAESRIGADLPY
ncbi:hypothetical protein RU820_05325 [Acidithiobacillus ferrooxidans]|uniref:Uncharacterized protein n=1 Tax=Acidithiobacillus ferrooxidans (strain ATCC 23270 / DSM 14882 / CIP 104768 / NCIMB 8455) TaxID=243159 RepID=B7J866_ACIF2|nr:hypothetical protein [Acidithiobacillus ferrooxidans]ACK79904.1 hypothetical protein AFE_1118 [Acidithiobacillus ferrooxidans ATCC 23270]